MKNILNNYQKLDESNMAVTSLCDFLEKYQSNFLDSLPSKLQTVVNSDLKNSTVNFDDLVNINNFFEEVEQELAEYYSILVSKRNNYSKLIESDDSGLMISRVQKLDDCIESFNGFSLKVRNRMNGAIGAPF